MAAVIFQAAAGLWAFSFEPMNVSFEPSGPNSIKTFRVKNDNATESVAIIVSVTTREIDENGKESQIDASADFTIFPSRFILDKGATRALKVQYKGTHPGKTEKAYRIIAEQVPAAFQEAGSSGISILIRYLAAVYVRAPETAPHNIKAVQALGTNVNGERGVLLSLRNDGGTHVILLESSLELLDPNGGLIELEGETTAPLNGQNILAGNSRTVFIPSDAVEELAYEPRLKFKTE